MKGNKLLFSRYKADRVKGYRKLLKKQDTSYKPPADIVKDIGEAMEAQGWLGLNRRGRLLSSPR